MNIGSAINIRGDPIVAQNSGGRLEVFAVNAANNQLYHKWQNIASNSDSWSAWVNIGSGITIRGTPIVAKNLDGRLEVFAVNAANNQLYHKWQTKAGDSNSWSAWEVLGLNVKSGTNPVIVSNKDGRLEVFAVNAANNQLYHKWQNSPNSRYQLVCLGEHWQCNNHKRRSCNSDELRWKIRGLRSKPRGQRK